MAIRILHVIGTSPGSDAPWIQVYVSEQIESLRKIGLELDILDLSKFGDGLKKYVVGIGELRKRVRAKHYNLIHAHYSYCGWVARFQRQIPLIVSLLGSDLLGTPDKRGHQTLRGYFDIAFSRLLAGHVDHVIVKSDEMSKLVPHADRISVIPNGVDFEIFKPLERSVARAELGIAENERVILFVANPEQSVKNYPLARAAVQRLQQHEGGVTYNLYIFWKRAHADLPIVMNAADVLLLTSFQEGSPNVVKEAMACNLPIIAVRVGDVAEVINGTRNCYLANYDPLDIADKIGLVLQSGKRSNGREYIDHLRMEKIALKVRDVYLDVIQRRHVDQR